MLHFYTTARLSCLLTLTYRLTSDYSNTLRQFTVSQLLSVEGDNTLSATKLHYSGRWVSLTAALMVNLFVVHCWALPVTYQLTHKNLIKNIFPCSVHSVGKLLLESDARLVKTLSNIFVWHFHICLDEFARLNLIRLHCVLSYNHIRSHIRLTCKFWRNRWCQLKNVKIIEKMIIMTTIWYLAKCLWYRWDFILEYISLLLQLFG